MTNVNDIAVERVTRAIGRVAGPEIIREALTQLGLREIGTPNDLLRFAEYFVEKGGVYEAVGRGLKVSAVLRGASAA